MKTFYLTLSVMAFTEQVYRSGVFELQANSIGEAINVIQGLHIGFASALKGSGRGEAAINIVTISEKKPRGRTYQFSLKDFTDFMT